MSYFWETAELQERYDNGEDVWEECKALDFDPRPFHYNWATKEHWFG